MSLGHRFLVVASFLISGWASAQSPDETAHRLMAAKARCEGAGRHEYSLRGNLLEDRLTDPMIGTMVWQYRLDAIKVELLTQRNGEDQYVSLSCNAPGCMGYETTSFKGTRRPRQLTPVLAWTCRRDGEVVELHRQLTRYIDALPKATAP